MTDGYLNANILLLLSMHHPFVVIFFFINHHVLFSFQSGHNSLKHSLYFYGFVLDNSCKKQTLGQFTFNSTLSGRFAYSNEKCEVGTSGGKSSPQSNITLSGTAQCSDASLSVTIPTQLVNLRL